MIALRYTQSGVPTRAEQIIVTAGAQQAVWLVAKLFAGPGTTTIVEDPTYRGTLEAFGAAGGQLRGIPMKRHGPDLEAPDAASANADLLYTATAVQNPTGPHYTRRVRATMFEIARKHGLLVIDDHSQADLPWHRNEPLTGMEAVADADELLIVGTLSKLFWGGIRVGWIRGPVPVIAQLTSLKSGMDLGDSVPDQLAATLLLPRIPEQLRLRRAELTDAYKQVVRPLSEVCPRWRFQAPAGGSGLWVDTADDSMRLMRRAERHNVRLAPGPLFSVSGGCRMFIRLPVLRDPDRLREALNLLTKSEETSCS